MIKSEEARALLIKLSITNYTCVKCGFQPMTRQNTSVRRKSFTYCFHYGQQIERKRLVEIWYSGKQRIKQQRITYIISIMNCNDCWNIMAPKEKIMLCSLQKSEKGESLLPIKYMSMKGVSEG